MNIKVNHQEADAVMHMLFTAGQRNVERYREFYPDIKEKELPYHNQDEGEIIIPLSKYYTGIIEHLVQDMVGLTDPAEYFTEEQNEKQKTLALGILKKIDAGIDDITREKLANHNVDLAKYIH